MLHPEQPASVLERTCVVVVTFDPDLNRLGEQFARLGEEHLAAVVVIDNGSQNRSDVGGLTERHGFEMISLPENAGIAAAQNVGIERARTRGADLILLLDHDSVPERGALVELTRAYLALVSASVAVAAVGTRYARNADERYAGFTRARWFRHERLDCSDPGQTLEVDHLISSGMLIPISTIDVVGPMMGELFIDRVDHEWCLRAAALGYRAFGACGARMRHSLGDRGLRLWAGRWRTPGAHAGSRYFYIVRNSIWLYRQPYASKRWVSADLTVMAKVAVVACLAPQRLTNLRCIAKGLRAGFGPTYLRSSS